MNSLMSYGSDDDSNDTGDEKFPEMSGRQNLSVSKNYRKPAAHEDNYEEVGMDMSEDSDDSSGPPPRNREEPRHNSIVKSDRPNIPPYAKRRSEYQPTSGNNSYLPQSDRRSGSNSPKNRKEEDDKRRSEDRNREDRYKGEDKYRRRDERGSRDSRESRDDDRNKDRDKSIREDDKGRDRYRDDRRDRRDRDDRYSRDRRDRDRRRSRSRDRRRSRSPRRVSRSPRRTSRSPRRSRSGSRDRAPKFLSRREKADKRMDRLDKLGIQFKPDNYPASAIQDAEINSKNNGGNGGGNRFFVPGITGRFREQIEKRKQLWQKAKEQDPVAASTSAGTGTSAAGGSKATKVYEATTFSDDKTSNKFKRLMGIKETDTESLPVKATDVLKKQQEMFSSMEAQYEVARTATHTMRGVGLGFGSFQR